MQLEHLQFEPRPRGHWEALDLGTLLARRWYSRLFVLWLLPAAGVFLLTFALLPSHPGIAMLICWWLKPVYERMPLNYLSRAVFADEPGFRESLRGGWRAVPPGMLAMLTFRRLSPVRSFAAPVYVLEGATGEARRDRLKVLVPRAGSAGLWLTVLGVHVEGFLVFAMLALAFLLVPSSLEVDWLNLLLAADQESFAWLLNMGSFAAMALVAPFYVAGGFALYLNRRVELEAWDVELGFRRLARRLTAPVALLLCILALPLPQGQAAEVPPEPRLAAPLAQDGVGPDAFGTLEPARAESRRVIAEILAEEDFHEQSSLRYPAFLDDLLGDGEDRSSVDVGWLAGIFRWVARGVEVAFWVIVLLGVVWLARRVRWSVTMPLRASGAVATARRPALGVPAAEERDLAGVPETAGALWRRGRPREALALLYAATLSRLTSDFGCEFRDSDTERECLTKAASAPVGARRYLAELTRVWTRLAYAHRLPDEASFDALRRRWETALQGDADAR